MPRFVRRDDALQPAGDTFADDGAHPELIERVQAYCRPMVPDRESSLSLRDQHLSGFLFNRLRQRAQSEGSARR